MAKIEMNRSVTTNMEHLAESLAKRASGETTGVVENFLLHKAESKGGPIRVMLALQKNYGADIAEFPEPGTETGNKPEYFMVDAKRGGNDIQKPMSFYVLFYRNTNEGKRNLATLEHISLFKRAKSDKKLDDSEVPDSIKDMNEEQLDALEKTLKNRETTASQAYRNAMALAYKFEKVNELEGIEASLRFEDAEKTKPIIGEGSIVVRDANDYTKYNFYSVTSFLLLNPDVASEKGGTLKALKESVKRNVEGKNDKAAIKVETLDTFKKVVIAGQSYAGKLEDATDAEAYGKLLKELGPKGPTGSDDFALTFYRLYTFMDQVYQNETIKARAVKLFNSDAVSESKAA